MKNIFSISQIYHIAELMSLKVSSHSYSDEEILN